MDDIDQLAVKRMPMPQKPLSMYESNGWDDNKSDQRKFVLDEAKRLFGCPESGLRLLSLPGESWEFERKFISRFPGSDIVGIESNLRSYENAFRKIPVDSSVEVKHRTINLSGLDIEMTKFGDRIVWINAHLDQVDFIVSSQRMRNAKYKWIKLPYDAIWLDTNSPVGTDQFLRHLRMCVGLLKNSQKCFLAFSFVVGRDCSSMSSLIQSCPGATAIDKRASFLRFMVGKEPLTDVLSVSSHQYGSANSKSTLTIGTVCLFIKRGQAKEDASDESNWFASRDVPPIASGSMRDFMSRRFNK